MIFNTFTTFTIPFVNFPLTGIAAMIAYFLVAAAVVFLGVFLKGFVTSKLFPALTKIAEAKNRPSIQILLKGFAKPVSISVFLASIFVALQILPWSPVIKVALFSVFFLSLRVLFIIMLTAGLWASSDIAELLFNSACAKFDFEQTKTITMVLRKTYRVLIVVFCLLTIMNEFNFEITAFVTGLGLIGLTVSLAAQDSASNLFAGLLILIERPFNIGDWISINGIEGIVEDISFRSTKIRALDNSLYVLPNANVSGTTINNGTNREKRMYRFTLGVTYDTTRAQLEQLMADIEAMLKANENVFDDSVIVKLTGFGSSSIDLLITCYLNTVELPVFLGLQNELHLNIMDIMNKNGTKFAFPSTSVYLEKTEE